MKTDVTRNIEARNLTRHNDNNNENTTEISDCIKKLRKYRNTEISEYANIGPRKYRTLN